MTYEEALNKMQDYGLDDEGDEAIEKLSEALEVLRILKKYPEWTGSFRSVLYMSDFWKKSGTPVSDHGLYCNDFPFSVEEFKTIVKWLEEERK